MQPAEFTQLSTAQQLDILYYQGDILANRYEEEHIFLLYSLHNFYVELRHDAYTNQLQAVSAFKDTEQLEAYLPYLTEEVL
ncbi:hypothetical protein F5984_12795 [Rudanella paleaurantiibacter]|uniref:Uncharacterized protein n=1 Tax=Rudanella paleaurantiibacter TaxID=2614655 RepID=A0A7J5TYB8_9BACT|nr:MULTISPECIES: hypothetical protein [Rudanella]KAB7730055.1 hypothetical protein F5984_12795 [Rudanella paleaurantiibacter]